jgi:HK97 family phage portal protein
MARRQPTRLEAKSRNRARQAARAIKGKGGGWEILSGIPSVVSSDELWQDMTPPQLEGLYRSRSIIYACTHRIVTATQEAPLRVGRETSQGWEDAKSHPLSEMLKCPNDSQSYLELLADVVLHLLLTGRSYIWKWRDRAGRLAGLWSVPTSWVVKQNDESIRIYQGPDEKYKHVQPADFTRIEYSDPSNPKGFCGPLQAALRDLQIDDERANHIVEMLTNLKAPGLIFRQPAGWDEDQKADVRATLASTLSPGRRGSPLFLEGADASIELTAPLKDLDWPGLTSLSETRICSAFGVPPIVIGLRSGLERATYSNFEQAEKTFYEGTVTPLWTLLNRALTRGLLLDEGDTAWSVYHDTEDVHALEPVRSALCDRAIRLFEAGLISRNRAREIAGENRLDRADERKAGETIREDASSGA